jgi:protoporphyrinogen oxidase
MVDFPFQKNIHQLPHDDFLECLHDLYFREERAPDSFLEMLYARFGRGIAEKFLVPYNEKLYATRTSASST